MQPYLALITPLSGGGPVDPGYGFPGFGPGHPSQPIYHPGHPDHGLPSVPGHPGNRPPGSWGGHPSAPIYHPGHPDHGLPSQPGHPGNRPPGSYPGRPSQGLPEGEPIDPDEINPPLGDPSEEYADKVIVAIKKPDEEWKITAYEADTFPDQGLPPTPEPK